LTKLKNKKLSYRRVTARCVMSVSSCNVSRDMVDRKVSNSKVTFKVIQGHSQWCHSISHARFPISVPLQLHVYLAPLMRYYHFLPKISRGHVTPNTSLLEEVY